MKHTFLVALSALIACGCVRNNDSEVSGATVTGVEYASAESGIRLSPSPNGVYIVVLHDKARPASVAKSVGARPTRLYRHALNGFAAPLSSAALNGLLRNPQVRFINPDRPMKAIAQTLPTGIRRSGADTNPIAQIDGAGPGLDVDVAVLDSGIDAGHPDLNVVAHVDCTGGPNKQTCKSGGTDDNGHGTHVGGTIGARDNGFGVVGVAPGARLWGVKVLKRNGTGWTSNIIGGIDYVAANAADIEVANMSLGGGGSDDTDGGDCLLSNDAFHLAICGATHAGVVFVVAAGNESSDASTSTPAAYDEVITVSALADFDGEPGGQGSGTFTFSSCTESDDDSFACFSNFGTDVDIMAPGVGILSTVPGGGYGSSSGTSMAAPHVAGAAALLLTSGAKPTDLAGVLALRSLQVVRAAVCSPFGTSSSQTATPLPAAAPAATTPTGSRSRFWPWPAPSASAMTATPAPWTAATRSPAAV